MSGKRRIFSAHRQEEEATGRALCRNITGMLAAAALMLTAGLLLMPLRARAEVLTGTFGTPDENGNYLSYSYDGDTQVLTVSGEGGIGNSLLDDVSFVLGPDIRSTVKKIVFENCTPVSMKICGAWTTLRCQVEEIDLSGLNTSRMTSMAGMFSDCRDLTTLDISGFDTSNVTDMHDMFANCHNLTVLDVSGFDTSNVTNMAGMFGCCGSVVTLDVSRFDTSNVTDMSIMFQDCGSLSMLDVSGFDTSKVTNMVRVFEGCGSLSMLDVSSFDTSNVMYMLGMFHGCSNMTTLDVSGFDTGNVIDMTVMFAECSSMTTLDVSGFDTNNVIGMGSMFSYCSSLTTLDVSGFDTSQVTNMESMFSGCSSIGALDVSGFDTSKVTNMTGMFSSCSSIAALDVSGFDTRNVKWGLILNDCDALTEIKAPAAMAEAVNASLPGTFYDVAHYESTGEYITTSIMDSSWAGKTLRKYSSETPDDPVISEETLPGAVLYVPYEQHLLAGSGIQDCAVLQGSLPAGMELVQDGTFRGIPGETGEFVFTAGSASVSSPQTTYHIAVADNSSENAEAATDPGYEIIQRVPDFTAGAASSHTLVSIGDYSEFRDAYIDGTMLEEGKDYTSEAGSTRITIQSETLDRFSQPGLHTIVVEFRSTADDLKRAVQNYWVNESAGQPEGGDRPSGGDSGQPDDGDRPSGDDSEQPDGDGSSKEEGEPAGAAAAGTYRYYTVVGGDTLGGIARRNGIRLAQLLAWNPWIKNPNLIFPGQLVAVGYTQGNMSAVPSADLEGAVFDEVRTGDCLYNIAWRNHVSLNAVMALNPDLVKQKYIYAGQKVRIQ